MTTTDVELTEQVRLAAVSRTIVRAVSSELTLQRVVEVCQAAILEGFRASGVWTQSIKGDELGHEAIQTDVGVTIELAPEMRGIGLKLAKTLCDLDAVAVFEEGGSPSGVLSEEDERLILEMMANYGIRRLLVVPISVGRECLGCMAVSRHDLDSPWTPGEQRAAQDVGRDLGRALATARTFEKERRVVEELREINVYKARLITTLAHELKNPLTAILGHVEMLDDEPELDTGVQHSIEVIERGGLRMQRLVEDLLVLSRSSVGDTPFSPCTCDLIQIVEESLDVLGVEVMRKNLTIIRDFLPGSSPVWGEPHGLELLINNLLSNAVKYTRNNGTVTIRLRRRDQNVVVEITDTGLGISTEDQADLFREFFRSTNPEALASPGSGLGLSIVRQVVDRHRGTITFSSELGVGTTFVVTLPASTE